MLSSIQNRSPRARRTRCRLAIESLESRDVPTGITSFVTLEHMHLTGSYDTGGQTWSMEAVDSDNDVAYPLDSLGMYVATHQPLTEAAGSEFVGAGVGGTYYQLPQNPDGEFLSVAFTGYGFSPSIVAAYDPSAESKGRVQGVEHWVKYSLEGVHHTKLDGTPGTGQVSVSTGGNFGVPLKVYMSSFNDGVSNPDANGLDTTDGISADDAVWVPAGGHLHYNWGFTQPGRYDVTFQVSAPIGGTTQHSQLFTAHFVVGSAGQLEFNQSDYHANAAAGTATITVHRVNGSDGQLTVNFATSDGTAQSGVDYTPTSGTLTFLDGETSQIFTVPLVNASPTGSKTVNLTLSDPGPFNLQYYLENVQGSTLLAGQSAAVLTIDAVSAPTVTSVTPAIGPTNYSNMVTITGTGFSAVNSMNASAVKFGNLSAVSFVVNSDTQITAYSPVVAVASDVNVTVTNSAGTSSASAQGVYSYRSSAQLTGTVVNGGDPRLQNLPVPFADQRSMVRSLKLTFDMPVTLSAGAVALSLHAGFGLLPGTIFLANSTGGSSADTTWIATFVGTNVDVSGSIADGRYDVTIDPNKVTDAAGHHLAAAPPAFTFFRLFGDADGNGTINSQDIVYIRRQANTTEASPNYLWLFDSDWNGSIGTTEIINARRNLGKIA